MPRAARRCNPTNRHIRLVGGAPQTGLTGDLDLALAATIPIFDFPLLPFRLGIFQALLRRRTTRAFAARPGWRAGTAHPSAAG